MTALPNVTILIVTYNRPREIRETLRALVAHIVYPADHLLFHIADDGSPAGYLDEIRRDFGKVSSYTVTARQGWGANVNKALIAATTDYVFLCEDDYVAVRPVKLLDGVLLLQATDALGLVRFDGIAGHRLHLELQEAKSGDMTLQYMQLMQDSPCLNVYSNRPHLRHRRFTDFYGFYPEGVKLGDTEVQYAHRIKDLPGPGIAVLEDGIIHSFDHIGHSHQNTSEDVGI